jgi:hypothetical protein
VRDGMDEVEFWHHVGRSMGAVIDIDIADDVDQSGLDELALAPQPCPVCGSMGACGYDAEGRALIHPDNDYIDE